MSGPVPSGLPSSAAAAGAFGGGAAGAAPPPPRPPPDVFFGGLTSLCDQLDKLVLVILRDGRHVIGRLSSFDTYGTLALERAFERKIAFGARRYADRPVGHTVLRGENLVLLAELPPGAGGPPDGLLEADWNDVEEDEAAEAAAAAAARLPRVGAGTGWGCGGDNNA